jgi:hypothetical protein
MEGTVSNCQLVLLCALLMLKSISGSPEQVMMHTVEWIRKFRTENMLFREISGRFRVVSSAKMYG